MSTSDPELDLAVDKIERYDAELGTSLNNTTTLQNKIGAVRDDVQIVERAISKIEAFRHEVRSFDDDLGKLKTILNLVGKASALKTFADTGKTMLSKVESVTERLDSQLKTVVQKIEASGVTTTLRKVDKNLEKAETAVGNVAGEIAAQKDAFNTVADIAAKVAVVSTQAIKDTGALVTAPLQAVEAINDLFDDENADDGLDSVREFINDFGANTPDTEFNAFLKVELEMDKVFSSLDAIRKPLGVISDVLKPIEPLLAAADFVASLTVDPVVDFVENTLGIQKLIDAAASKVEDLLPDTNALNGLEGALDKVLAALNRYDFNTASDYDFDADAQNDPDPFGIGEWIFDRLQKELLETAVGKIGAVDGGGGIAIEIPEGIRGADTDDDLLAGYKPGNSDVPINISNLILIGDDKDNRITATGGTNALYGADGNDTLFFFNDW